MPITRHFILLAAATNNIPPGQGSPESWYAIIAFTICFIILFIILAYLARRAGKYDRYRQYKRGVIFFIASLLLSIGHLLVALKN